MSAAPVDRTVRVVVMPMCEPRCPSCVSCSRHGRRATLAQVRRYRGAETLILGGGDATRWPPLSTLLALNSDQQDPQHIWIEAPARSFTLPVLRSLAKRGTHGIRVHIEGSGERMLRTLGVGDGEKVVAEAEALGLQTQCHLCMRPKTFSSLLGVAKRLAPRRVTVEFIRRDWGQPEVPIWPDSIARALRTVPNITFSTVRRSDSGYLPACALPGLWEDRPTIWRSTFAERDDGNRALESCASCVLRDRCRWNDPEALAAEVRAKVQPIAGSPEPWRTRHLAQDPVPIHIRNKRREPGPICVMPWTTMEVVDPDGLVRQCCSTWTHGHRGDVSDMSLTTVWNGDGYREARRLMARNTVDALCHTICPRLYDHKFAEREFRIQKGSEAFVANQLLLAEEIAERREVLSAKPLQLSLCPSTYCNYDCIMCDLGRTPRRDLPESIWAEIPIFLPTLRSLTLLGGEPLANPLVMKLLRDFDVARYPDASIDLVTNGSLLTAAALRHMTRCTLGDVTVSLNAGTEEVYRRVQRGISLAQVIENIDALRQFRSNHHRWFRIKLSFVLQPAAIDTIIDFGEIARARNLPIRLLTLSPENHDGLDFYPEPDQVAHVLGRLDEFIAYCERVRPDWLGEARAGRAAVVEEARKRAPNALRVLR